ncbi:hypothetical protein DVH05_002516 [Phytophthora capsici]|nr:hypothetical protein DVH05_002516 [Phytophthora capsici]
MRAFNFVLLTAVMATVTGAVGATTHANENAHTTRLLSKIKTQYNGDAGGEERNGLAALQGLKKTFEMVADMPFDKAWHHLQMIKSLNWEKTSALLWLHQLGPKEREAVLKLIT